MGIGVRTSNGHGVSVGTGALLLIITLVAWPATFHGAAAQEPPQTFRSGIELVEVPVLVRDRDGRLVRDLTQDDFQVLEDGAPQALAFFERVDIPVVPREASPVMSIPRDVATNDVPADSRLFVLLLDSLHVAPVRTGLVRKYAREFIERHIGASDLVAVISPGALPEATQDFTTDKARLLAAIERFSGSKLRSAATEIEEERRMAGALGTAMHEGRDPSDPERADRVGSLASTLDALARHLSTVERRRKTLLFFSEGIDYNIGDFGGFTQGKQRYATEVVAAMEKGIAALVRASVALYAIDPRGLSLGGPDASDLPIHGERPDANLSTPNRYAEFAESIRSLRHFAETTGGFAAVNTNEFGSAFDRIVEEASSYYVLGYAPGKPARGRDVRRIEVRVSRPGVTVVARKVYTAPRIERRPSASPPVFGESAAAPGPPLRGVRRRAIETLSDPGTAASATRGLPAGLETLLASPLPRPGLPLRLQAIPFRSDGRRHAVTLLIEVPGQGLAFVERGGKFQERIQLALLTVDDRARAGNGTSTTLDLRLTPEELGRVKATGVRWLSRLSLAPGRHQVRVAARAERTNASGLATVEVDVPRFEPERLELSGIALTSLPSPLLITRGEGRRLQKLPTPPTTSRTFVVGDRVTAVVEVYLPRSVPSDIELSARVGPVPDGATILRARQRVAHNLRSAGRAEVAFTIDTSSLPPGQYVLRIAAQPPSTHEGPERAVPFAIVAAPR